VQRVQGKRELPDPLLVLVSPSVRVAEDGVLHATTAEAAHLIKLLGLNEKPSVEFRLLWIGIIALAAKADVDLHRRLMTFPDDLPDLESLKPPGGNSRPEGVASSFFVRRRRGELEDSY
jgi:hypothetical protein